MMTMRLKVLKYLSEQRYASLQDLYIGSGSSARRETFRVSLYEYGLSRFSFYGVSGGVWYIEKPAIYEELQRIFPQEPLYKNTKIHLNEVIHALGMNTIHHRFINNDRINVQSWLSEYQIRALPASSREFSYKKIPDAILTRRLEDGSTQKCFIEYERSLKSRERYGNIFKSYAARTDVTKGSVIFICQSGIIKKELLKVKQEVIGKGIFNEQEEVFQFIEFDQMRMRTEGVNVRELV